MTFDVIIIGGGPAGCSAAIQLASRGLRVALLEQKNYPVQKLCGEFLSTEVHALLKRVGVLDAVLQADARPIRRAVFSSSRNGSFTVDLPGQALGISRYCLDFLLFLRARELGTHCIDGAAVHGIEGNLEAGFEVSTRGQQFRARVVVGAFGKRSRIDGVLDRAFLQRREPFSAFKAHYEGMEVPPQVEVHAFPGGYCGIAPIENGLVNVCWMARDQLLKSSAGIEGLVSEHLSKNPQLQQRLAGLERVSEQFEAVSQVTLGQKTLFDRDVCMIGDAAQMIAPLCGDGMAMALRSAELAAPPIAQFLMGDLSTHRLKRLYTRRWKEAFSQRLHLGKIIQRLSVHPVSAAVAVQMCRMIPPIARWAARQTRGTGS